jgi:hypothetical protein
MLGKLKRVKASATRTNTETATVPTQPHLLPDQIPLVKIRTSNPKVNV